MGIDFHDYLNRKVGEAEILLALIADRWLSSIDDDGKRRLDNPNDFVRIEIEAALDRKIPVIPVYVDRAPPLKAEELPDSLKPLVRRNAAFLDTGVDFSSHVQRLIADIEQHLVGAYKQAPIAVSRTPKPAASAIAYENRAQRLVRTFATTDHNTLGGAVSAKFSPDGDSVLCYHDHRLKTLDISTGQDLRELRFGYWSTSCSSGCPITISPDGRLAIYGGDLRGAMELWDISTGVRVRSFKGHTRWVVAIAISDDGLLALSGASREEGSELKLWKISTGEELRSFAGHKTSLSAVSIAPDGSVAISCGVDGLKLWDTATGQSLGALTGDPVHSVVFTPDGRRAVSSGAGGLQLWDIGLGLDVGTFNCSVTANTVAIAPDGRTLLAGNWETMTLWDIISGHQLRTFQAHKLQHVESVAFSPDGRFALSSADEGIKLWDLLGLV